MGATTEIIENVAKLLALAAGNGTTPEEAATAAATAQRLMLRHRIERAEVDAFDADDPIGLSASTGSEGEQPFLFQTQRWQLELLKAIAATNGCMLVVTRKERSGKWINLVGRRSDLEVCGYLWSYLSGEIERLRAQQTRGWSAAQKRHFCLGATHTISAALARETAAANAPGENDAGALVISSRYEAAKAWFLERNPRARFVGSRHVSVDPLSYQAGRSAGSQVSIRKGVSTTTNPRRLLT